jgi:hypothetical protein
LQLIAAAAPFGKLAVTALLPIRRATMLPEMARQDAASSESSNPVWEPHWFLSELKRCFFCTRGRWDMLLFFTQIRSGSLGMADIQTQYHCFHLLLFFVSISI